jgi:hypothetical protein
MRDLAPYVELWKAARARATEAVAAA